MEDVKFDFDDILIVSKKTHIKSRYKDILLPPSLPLFTAPMDTVINLDNVKNFIDNQIHITLPRTIKYNDFLHSAIPLTNIFVSMGFNDLNFFYKENFKAFKTGQHLLIDVANGHMQKIVDYATEIKRLRPDIVLMVGNIGSPDMYKWYAENKCVDYIRIGIGNGGGCLTTKQSGIGYPMASLIHETYKQKMDLMKSYEGELSYYYNDFKLPKIVADGGMKNYSDIIKAHALGADYVMIGSLFNKALESCAQNYLYGIKIGKKTANKLFGKGYPIKKYFRGMSTKDAQKAMGKTVFKTSEGVVRFRKVEYHLNGWVENYKHYLRNAMSYSNAKTLDDFIGKVNFCQITKNSYERFNK